jgi:hypothetical protein
MCLFKFNLHRYGEVDSWVMMSSDGLFANDDRGGGGGFENQVGALYKLNPLDPQVESVGTQPLKAWAPQPLNLKCRGYPGFKPLRFFFKRVNLYRYNREIADFLLAAAPDASPESLAKELCTMVGRCTLESS